MADIQALGSCWEDGAGGGGSMRLLIGTPAGDLKWPIDAGDDEIVALAQRLQPLFRSLRAPEGGENASPRSGKRKPRA